MKFLSRHPVLAVVTVFIVIAAGVAAGWAIKYATADVRGRIEANETIKSGANRIAQYNRFFNACAAVQANEGALDASLAQLAETTSESEKERIRANITGLRATRSRTIAEYNSDATKNYTNGQFRDSDLPYQLVDTDYPKGGGTRCASS